jgi:hypothetical protein
MITNCTESSWFSFGFHMYPIHRQLSALFVHIFGDLLKIIRVYGKAIDQSAEKPLSCTPFDYHS